LTPTATDHAPTRQTRPPAAPTLRRMWRVWSLYGASSILSRSIAFLLLPVYTRVLTPHEYGIRAIVSLGTEATLLVVAFGLKEAINRFYSSADAEGIDPAHAASTGIIAHAAMIGLGSAVGFVLAPWLAGPLLGDATLAPFLQLGFVGACFAHVQEAALVYERARGRSRVVAITALATLVALVSLNLLLVVGLRWGVAGIFWAEIGVFAVTAAVLTVRALRELGVRFVPRLARQMGAFGLPLMFIPFAWLCVSRSDAMFLTHYGSLAYVGIYALSTQCAQVLQFALIGPFHQFWDAAQFAIARDPAGPRIYRRMFQWFTFTAVVAAFACAIAVDDVIRLMTAPAFHQAAAVVPLLLVSYVMLGTFMFFNAALLIRKRTLLVAGVALVTAVVNIAINAVLVPHFMAFGAAAARVVALTVMVGATFMLAQRLWPQRPDFVALAKVTGWAGLLFAAERQLPDLSLPLTLVTTVLFVAALVALSFWSHAIERADLVQGWRLIRSRVRRRACEESERG
jgi:O-antigen/teichoic acid export membrane protein